MSDSIKSSNTTPSPSVGGYEGSISPEIGSSEVSSSPNQVITGTSVTIDQQVPELMQESYNNSYATLSEPDAEIDGYNISLLSKELAPINQQITQFISSSASAETSSDILDAIQLSLEEEERIYEKYYAPGAPDPAVTNATLLNKQEDARLVAQLIQDISMLALSA